jgi:vacuolar-type H+-ATPase subunit I/STV1
MVSVTTGNSLLKEALEDMRSGALLLIVGWFLVGIAVVGGPFTILRVITRGTRGVGGILVTGFEVLLMLILVLLGVIIMFIGFFWKFISGTQKLAQADKRFTTASQLVGLYRWGLVLALISIILAVTIVDLVIAIPLAIVTLILILFLLGSIGLIILSFNLNEVYKNILYLVAGILFIIGIFIPILNAISFILLYIALGDTIEKLSTTPTPNPTLV